jgi:hypothetical protein
MSPKKKNPKNFRIVTVALAGPRSPSLPTCAVAVICGRTWSARSNAYSSVRSNALPAFERRPVTCQSINRTLVHFVESFSFGRVFKNSLPL